MGQSCLAQLSHFQFVKLEALIQGLSLIFTWALQGLISTRNSSFGQATHSDLLKLAFISSFFPCITLGGGVQESLPDTFLSKSNTLRTCRPCQV